MILRVSTQGEAEGVLSDRGRLRTKPTVKRKCHYGKTENGLWNVTMRRNTKGGKLQLLVATDAEGEVIMWPAMADNAAKSPTSGWLHNGQYMRRWAFLKHLTFNLLHRLFISIIF